MREGRLGQAAVTGPREVPQYGVKLVLSGVDAQCLGGNRDADPLWGLSKATRQLNLNLNPRLQGTGSKGLSLCAGLGEWTSERSLAPGTVF